MARRVDVVAIVGGGRGGRTVLDTLLRTPGIEVRYVYDRDPDAPAMVLAREHGILCSTDTTFPELWGNAKVNVILEVTGSEAVFRSLGGIKAQTTSLIGARGNRLVFDILASENRARQRLEHYQNRLKELVAERTSQLERSNRELGDRLRELAALNERLEEMSMEKTQYLLRSTHQLKAPFAAIQSYTDLILGGYAGELTEQTHHVIGKIKERCEMLATAIQEMLQLASLHSLEGDGLKMAGVSINRLVDRIVRQNEILAQSAGVTLRLRPAPGAVRVRCNPEQMAALVDILVKNAIDYSHPDTCVDVTVAVRAARVVVRVKDRGIGIREDASKNVFSEFYRTNEAAAKNPNGSGLGLAIAAGIAALHGFRISLRSTAGKGATFSVSMPAGSATGTGHAKRAVPPG